MKAVIGMGYGDEGKGLTTSYLCSKTINPLVVRFNGGHQAGHTVVYEGQRHIFSNFGSGSLQGVPTLWSHFCTFHPSHVLNEYNALNNPKLFVHGLCPITTPYEIQAGCEREKAVQHGSVGLGFGATIQRQQDYFNLYVQDLPFESIVRAKLHNISLYYGFKLDITQFLADIREVLDVIDIVNYYYNLFMHYNPIFEGAQGILLDQDFGFFPNVTRSNTTTHNVLSLTEAVEVFYVTRTYQTRHGNGFMTNEGLPLELVNIENETNVLDEWQGVFRKSVLDIDLLNYALTCDNNFSKNCQKNLIISCVDQTGYDFDVTVGGKIKRIELVELPTLLNAKFENVLFSKGDSLDCIESLPQLVY